MPRFSMKAALKASAKEMRCRTYRSSAWRKIGLFANWRLRKPRIGKSRC